jgi:hypothetical protein
MSAWWAASAAIAAGLAVFLPLQRSFHRRLQVFLHAVARHPGWALGLYSLILLPGVLTHELSHWAAARLLRVPIHHLSLRPRRIGKGAIRFGYVETARVDGLRMALIAGAPLLTGMALLGWLVFGYVELDGLIGAMLRLDPAGMSQHWLRVVQVPDLALWIYLGLAISNTMLPSSSDRGAWIPLVILLAGLSMAAYWRLPGSEWLQDLGLRLAALLLIVAGLNLLSILGLRLGQAALDRLWGRDG